MTYNRFWQSLYQCADSFVVLQSTEFSETPSPDSDSVNSLEGHSEPSWFKDIKFDDSDTEQLADETDYVTPSKCLTTADILYQTVHSPTCCLLAISQTRPVPAKEHRSAVSTPRWIVTRPPSIWTWSRTMSISTSRSRPSTHTCLLIQPSKKVWSLTTRSPQNTTSMHQVRRGGKAVGHPGLPLSALKAVLTHWLYSEP